MVAALCHHAVGVVGASKRRLCLLCDQSDLSLGGEIALDVRDEVEFDGTQCFDDCGGVVERFDARLEPCV